ncbi:hypothetical protein DMH04_02510 [Kibdelosporangium aridum]|uniref:Membrane transport protein MMPL domain-containing protein n=1 Tax=Kibdelosporangium aridum TaxID=2030 RepID=A0A428ZV07_KIBAR|nr:MMPL family transporter [Kibdelosporangium aridum]RSM91855.1 hypothetical protein DMH04_02510 [Kibdelosporangium aridum]
MRVSWRACLEPLLASAVTVILGLLCLLLSDLNSNKSLGPVAAIGIAAALVTATIVTKADRAGEVLDVARQVPGVAQIEQRPKVVDGLPWASTTTSS